MQSPFRFLPLVSSSKLVLPLLLPLHSILLFWQYSQLKSWITGNIVPHFNRGQMVFFVPGNFFIVGSSHPGKHSEIPPHTAPANCKPASANGGISTFI
jgi:hypothetical protein